VADTAEETQGSCTKIHGGLEDSMSSEFIQGGGHLKILQALPGLENRGGHGIFLDIHVEGIQMDAQLRGIHFIQVLYRFIAVIDEEVLEAVHHFDVECDTFGGEHFAGRLPGWRDRGS